MNRITLPVNYNDYNDRKELFDQMVKKNSKKPYIKYCIESFPHSAKVVQNALERNNTVINSNGVFTHSKPIMAVLMCYMESSSYILKQEPDGSIKMVEIIPIKLKQDPFP